MPMKISSGNISLAMPASNSTLIAPGTTVPPTACVSAAVMGMFTSTVPNPIGSSSEGSYSLAAASQISVRPMPIITACCQVRLKKP